MGVPPIPLSRSMVRLLTRSAALMLEASAYDGRALPTKLRLSLRRTSEEIARLLARRMPRP